MTITRRALLGGVAAGITFGPALSDATIKQKMVVQGLDVHYLPGPEFGKFVDSESEKWSKIIREAGINKQ